VVENPSWGRNWSAASLVSPNRSARTGFHRRPRRSDPASETVVKRLGLRHLACQHIEGQQATHAVQRLRPKPRLPARSTSSMRSRVRRDTGEKPLARQAPGEAQVPRDLRGPLVLDWPGLFASDRQRLCLLDVERTGGRGLAQSLAQAALAATPTC
jgi:hypothetical protein